MHCVKECVKDSIATFRVRQSASLRVDPLSVLVQVYKANPAITVLGGICQSAWARSADTGEMVAVHNGVVGLAVGRHGL